MADGSHAMLACALVFYRHIQKNYERTVMKSGRWRENELYMLQCELGLLYIAFAAMASVVITGQCDSRSAWLPKLLNMFNICDFESVRPWSVKNTFNIPHTKG